MDSLGNKIEVHLEARASLHLPLVSCNIAFLISALISTSWASRFHLCSFHVTQNVKGYL